MDSSYQIINEYGILKKILSNLTIKDLIMVSQVNRYWKKVADIIIHENLEISCFVKQSEKSWPELNQMIRPKLIIYNNDSDKSEDLLQLMKIQLPEIGRSLEKYYNIEEVVFIYLANWKFINTLKKSDSLVTVHSSHSDDDLENSFKESLIMIPEFSGLKIDVEFFNMFTMKTVEKDYSEIVDKINDSKCCLFLTNSDLKNKVTAQIIKIFCDKANENGIQLVMAGGISHFMMCYDDSFLRVGGAVVSFSGESLTSKSFVISYTDNLTNSFEKMKEELGPLEAGYMRLAFVFTCVDRYHIYEESETEEFSKIFPDVPIYGFWSLGEFCHGYSPLTEKKKKPNSNFITSKGVQFFFQQASTYLILTFKK